MKIYFCMECMKVLERENMTCPQCGYRRRDDAQPAGAVRRESILHGRYVVGNILERTQRSYVYAGYDLLEMKRVKIHEFYPKRAEKRNSRETDRISRELLREQSMFFRRFLSQDAFDENGTAYVIAPWPAEQRKPYPDSARSDDNYPDTVYAGPPIGVVYAGPPVDWGEEAENRKQRGNSR